MFSLEKKKEKFDIQNIKKTIISRYEDIINIILQAVITKKMIC